MECIYCGAEFDGNKCLFCGRVPKPTFRIIEEAQNRSDHNLGAGFENGVSIDMEISDINKYRRINLKEKDFND